jgi:glutathione peroxidase
MIKKLIYSILKKVMKSTTQKNSSQVSPATSIFDIAVKDIAGNTTSLEKYKGKKIIIVNVASACGYTPQYAELQKMYEQQNGNVVILGFPCNDFGAQEQADESTIQNFCSINYGVTFPLYSKVNIKTSPIHPIYEWLSNTALNGWNTQLPDWNFCKYVIDEEGRLEGFFSSAVHPNDLLK